MLLATFQLVDCCVCLPLGGVDPGVEVSELGLGLEEGAEDLHLEHEGAQLPHRPARLLHHRPLTHPVVLSLQLEQTNQIILFSQKICMF